MNKVGEFSIGIGLRGESMWDALARKYGVEDQFDRKSFEEDLAIFLVKRKIVGLRELRVSVLEGGDIRVGDVIRGKRRADLIIRLHYKGVRRK